MRCIVPACNNNWAKTGKSVSYHRFPKDERLQKVWVDKCKLSEEWNPVTCHVCSFHFTEEDYERNLRGELMNQPARKRLLKTAFPSLNLTRAENEKRKTARKRPYGKKKMETAVPQTEDEKGEEEEFCINSMDEDEDKGNIQIIDYQEIKFADTENFITQSFDGCPQCHTFDEERQELQKRVEVLEQENDELRRKLEESNEAISNQWSNLKFSVVMQNNLSDAPPPLLLLKKDEESAERKRRLNREKVRRWRARQSRDNLDRIRRQDAEAHRLRVKYETQEQTQARQEALRKRREKETPQQRRARQQADAEAHRLQYMLKY